jgi:hypothetical protein
MSGRAWLHSSPQFCEKLEMMDFWTLSPNGVEAEGAIRPQTHLRGSGMARACYTAGASLEGILVCDPELLWYCLYGGS